MSQERVSAYSGSRYADRPAAFDYDGERLRVERTLRSWREPGTLNFKVRVEDGRVFQLTYDEMEKDWLIHIQQ